MSAEPLVRLRALARESEARWRALGPKEAARFVYHLQLLRMVYRRAASEAGAGDASDRRREEPV